jgi:hypothetical protein
VYPIDKLLSMRKRVYSIDFLLSLRREQTWEELADVPDWAHDDMAISVTAADGRPATSLAEAGSSAAVQELEGEKELLTSHSAEAGGDSGGKEDVDSLLFTLTAQLSGPSGAAYLAGCSPVDLTRGPAAAEEEDEAAFEVVAMGPGGAGGGELGDLLNTLSSQMRSSGLPAPPDVATRAEVPPQPSVAPASPVAAPAAAGDSSAGFNALLATLGAQLEQQRQLMQQQETYQQQRMQPPAASAPLPPHTSWPPLPHAPPPQPTHAPYLPQPPPRIPGIHTTPHPPLHPPPHPPPPPPQSVAPMQTPSALAATQHLSALLGIGGGGLGTAGAQPAPAQYSRPPAPFPTGAAMPHPPRARGGGGDRVGRGSQAQQNFDTFGGSDEPLDLSVFSQQSAAFHQEREHLQAGYGAPSEGQLGQRSQGGPAEPFAPNWQQQLFGRQL